jgi:hypothetical protein
MEIQARTKKTRHASKSIICARDCVFRGNSDRQSEVIRTAIQSNSDTDPI